MKQEIAEKWIAALRSGEYQQGHDALRRPDTLRGYDIYCCLGVLCSVCDPNGWELKNWVWYHRSNNIIPDETILATIGLERVKVEHLTTMNDKGVSFNQIADIIGKHWKQL